MTLWSSGVTTISLILSREFLDAGLELMIRRSHKAGLIEIKVEGLASEDRFEIWWPNQKTSTR